MNSPPKKKILVPLYICAVLVLGLLHVLLGSWEHHLQICAAGCCSQWSLSSAGSSCFILFSRRCFGRPAAGMPPGSDSLTTVRAQRCCGPGHTGGRGSQGVRRRGEGSSQSTAGAVVMVTARHGPRLRGAWRWRAPPSWPRTPLVPGHPGVSRMGRTARHASVLGPDPPGQVGGVDPWWMWSFRGLHCVVVVDTVANLRDGGKGEISAALSTTPPSGEPRSSIAGRRRAGLVFFSFSFC